MNNSELQAEVALICRIPTAHPMYSRFITPAAGSEDQSVINRAANRLITYAAVGNGASLDLFPELRNTWTAGPTTAGQNTIPTPSDCVIITDVACAHKATTPDWNVDREFPMNYQAPTYFGNLTKSSSVTNYASVWSKKGKNILFWPTASASFIDYFRYYGLKIENVLVSASDEFFMAPVWHDLVALLAAQMLSLKLGWYQQSAALWTQFQNDLGATVNVMAAEAQVTNLKSDGPQFTHAGVYGR